MRRSGYGLKPEPTETRNRDEKDPGMRVSQAMTRDAYIVSKSDDIRVRHLPVVNRAKRLSALCRLETCRLETSHARQSWGIGEALSRLSRPCEQNIQIG